MDRSLYFTSIGAVASAALRIIGTMYFHDFSVLVLDTAGAFYEISTHQAHFVAGEHTEIFLGRLFHEVLSLNIQFFAEGNLAAAQSFVFRIVDYRQHLRLSFGIVINYQFHRIQNSHHTGCLCLQILTDTILQHCIICGRLCLGDTAQFYELLDGFRCESSSAQCCDGYQSGIIPAVHDALFYQLLDITLTGHHIGQVQLCEFDLLGRMRIFQFSYHPVI